MNITSIPMNVRRERRHPCRRVLLFEPKTRRQDAGAPGSGERFAALRRPWHLSRREFVRATAALSLASLARPLTALAAESSYTLGCYTRLKKGGFTRGPLMVECLDRDDTPAKITAEAKKARRFVECLLV